MSPDPHSSQLPDAAAPAPPPACAAPSCWPIGGWTVPYGSTPLYLNQDAPNLAAANALADAIAGEAGNRLPVAGLMEGFDTSVKDGVGAIITFLFTHGHVLIDASGEPVAALSDATHFTFLSDGTAVTDVA